MCYYLNVQFQGQRVNAAHELSRVNSSYVTEQCWNFTTELIVLKLWIVCVKYLA